MEYPEIVPGLKVRYRETAYLAMRGEVRIVTRVDNGGIEGVGVKPGEDYERGLVSLGDIKARFWALFEVIEDESTEGNAQNDDGAGGVWVTSSRNPDTWEVLVHSIHDDELSAYRALDFEKTRPAVTFVSFGSDVADVIKATETVARATR